MSVLTLLESRVSKVSVKDGSELRHHSCPKSWNGQVIKPRSLSLYNTITRIEIQHAWPTSGDPRKNITKVHRDETCFINHVLNNVCNPAKGA